MNDLNLEKRITVVGYTVKSSDPEVQQAFWSWASGDREGAFLYGTAHTIAPGTEWSWEIAGPAALKTLRNRYALAAKDPADSFDAEVFNYVINAIELVVLRDEVEQVFGFTGGELEDEPFEYVTRRTGSPDLTGQFRFWMAGVPEWSEAEIMKRHPDNAEFITVCSLDGGTSLPPEVIYTDGDNPMDAPVKWERINVYSNSGEAECPGRAAEEMIEEHGCHLCEGTPGEEHGYIYLGDCHEVIYRRWTETEIEGVVRIEKRENGERRYFVGHEEVALSGDQFIWFDAHEGKRVTVMGSEWIYTKLRETRHVPGYGWADDGWMFDVEFMRPEDDE